MGEIEFYGTYAQLYDLQWSEKDKSDDLGFWVRLARRFRGPVLELACGTGRITLPLARAGLRITGLDVSREMLSIFAKKLGKEREEVRGRITLKKGDMRDFEFREKFGFAFVPFNSFLHLETVGDEEKCIRAVWRNLKPNGVFVIDVFKPDFKKWPAGTLHVDLAREYPEAGIKITRLSSREYEHAKQQIHAHYYMDVVSGEGKARRHETAFTLRYVRDVDEMKAMLEKCGFRLEKVHGDYRFGRFTPKSEKMIFVARKK